MPQAIVTGASDLLGEKVAALRLVDPDDPSSIVLAAATGVDDELFRRPVAKAPSAG